MHYLRKPNVLYNEFDPGAAAWLRELIQAGLIAAGEVDERSILDVRADDLRGFTQCHFFAGIGGWSYALRLAGWPDDRPVWTGSPPCQPFSAAGRQEGRNDARHLAPHFISLVGAARPGVLFGEQVASAEVFGKAAGGAGKRADGPPAWAWIDDLSDRLEAARYAVGASDFPSAGVGAPHIRQRTFFGAVSLADADDAGLEGHGRDGDDRNKPGRVGTKPTGSGRNCGADGGMENADQQRRDRLDALLRQDAGRGARDIIEAAGRSEAGRLADANGRHASAEGLQRGGEHRLFAKGGGDVRGRNSGAWSQPLGLADAISKRVCSCGSGCVGGSSCAMQGQIGERQRIWTDAGAGHDNLGSRPCPTNSVWRNADWLGCRDGKWRPVEPGTFPLAHGVSGRVGLLRGYGNAINPWAAKEFIQAFDASVRHLRLTETSEMATGAEDIFG